MTLKGFLGFVEIQTKAASVIPFTLGTIYSIYKYDSFNFKNFIIMFISLITFDMATTAINNYCDYKKAHTNEEYDYKVKNAIEKYNIKQSTAVFIIFTLLIIATAAGITLTLNTNVIVLLIGIVSFMAGILYTFGPIPISRMPLGEVFSGIFMGFIITFLAIYIHIYNENIVAIMYQNSILKININVFEVLYIFLVCIPSINGIANIMLANNICDVEEDVINKRFTLPYYIGKKSALKLFKVLYYISYLDIIILVILSVLPVTSLLTLFTLIPINKNIKLFYNQPVKSKTFVLAVKNFVLINLTYISSILIMIVFNYL